MSVYKPLLNSDIITTPLEVNKGFTFQGASELTGSTVGIDRFLGQNIDGTFSAAESTTGQINTEYRRLVYKSIQTLYYSNYISSSYGDPVSVPVYLPNELESGLISSAGRFENYLQTSLTYNRYFPTGSDSIVGAISIPVKLYGNYIKPNSVYITYPGVGNIQDDGEGNLLLIGTPDTYIGNIIYSHGLLILTDDTSGTISSFTTGSDITVSFSSSYQLYENQYKCTISNSEFNVSYNPTLLSGSNYYEYSSSIFLQPENGDLKEFTTGSSFTPYITTVGLYNQDRELIAVGKLAQPLPTSNTSDTTILVNIDS